MPLKRLGCSLLSLSLSPSLSLPPLPLSLLFSQSIVIIPPLHNGLAGTTGVFSVHSPFVCLGLFLNSKYLHLCSCGPSLLVTSERIFVSFLGKRISKNGLLTWLNDALLKKQQFCGFGAFMDIELLLFITRLFMHREKHGDQKVVDMKAGKSNREENGGRVIDCLQQISCCQSCQQKWDVLLMLPCSHTMCVQCISAGEAGKSSKSHLSAVCAVACPSCRHPVELPCWNWSSATSCLPKHPSVSRACVSKNINSTKDPHPQVR